MKARHGEQPNLMSSVLMQMATNGSNQTNASSNDLLAILKMAVGTPKAMATPPPYLQHQASPAAPHNPNNRYESAYVPHQQQPYQQQHQHHNQHQNHHQYHNHQHQAESPHEGNRNLNHGENHEGIGNRVHHESRNLNHEAFASMRHVVDISTHAGVVPYAESLKENGILSPSGYRQVTKDYLTSMIKDRDGNPMHEFTAKLIMDIIQRNGHDN